jgi:Ca-activated chloride channel homolog
MGEHFLANGLPILATYPNEADSAEVVMVSSSHDRSCGLYVQTPDSDVALSPIVFPLQHTDVQARVSGNVARVSVTQQFTNPFTTTLEAVYVFPLPDEAAVDSITIRMGDRTIKGTIKKRQDAQQIYDRAKQQGQTAGLLEQERDNIFTQSLANILPGECIEVTIGYTQSLKFSGGDYEFVFPMVVGPRYVPGMPIGPVANPWASYGSGTHGSAMASMTGNQDTNLVPDASRLNGPILPLGTRSSHDISVTVDIESASSLQSIQSPSHRIQLTQIGAIMRVGLAGGDTIPNKDLILRYQVAGAATQTTVLSQADERGGHFALYLTPALQYRPEDVVAKDVVFLIDTSGSQQGAPLQQCQALMRRMVEGLNPNDTFSILDFADTTQRLSATPLANTRQNRAHALNYINQLTANGGTQMLQGIQAMLNFPVTDPGRLRTIVLLTDGYIGNENQILALVQQQLQSGNRLHSFGAGSSVNRFLLNRIAEIGRGLSYIIRQDEPVAPVVDRFFRQINNPVLTNIQVQWEGAGEAPILHPNVLSDLFAEQPLVLFGHKPDGQAGTLHVYGVGALGDRYHQALPVNFAPQGNPAIAQLWGRSHLKSLTNQMLAGDTKAGVEAVTQTALTYQLLSQYTAFVAVSDEVRGEIPGRSISVQVPVEMPEGVDYQGVFGEVRSAAPAGGLFNRLSRVVRANLNEPLISKAVTPESSRAASLSSFAQPSPSAAFDESMFAQAPSMPDPNSPEIDAELDLLKSELFGETAVDSCSSAPRSEPPSPSGNRVQILSAEGLDARTIALLLRYLQAIQLPTGVAGDLVFEFVVNRGRVSELVWDDLLSSLKDTAVVEMIRLALIAWQPDGTIATKVTLVLRIQG